MDLIGEGLGQFELFGDFGRHEALVREPHGLIVHPAVEVALVSEELRHIVGAPTRPMMTGKHQCTVDPEQFQRLVDVLRPAERVAGLGTTQWQQVVHVVRAVLRHAQPTLARPVGLLGTALGEEEVHLGWGLGLGRELEDDPDAVDRLLLSGLGDVLSRRNQADLTHRCRLAEAAVDVLAGPGRQGHAELVVGAAAHRRPRDDVLEDGFVQEVLGGDDPDLA